MRLGPNFKIGTLMLVVVFALATAGLFAGAQLVKDDSVAAGGGNGSDEPAPSGPVTVRIVGKDQKFDKRSFTAGIGSQVTVTFDNQDPGVLHNIAFYTNRSATTKIGGTEVKPGPVVEDLHFAAPSSAGNFFYRCDVHPDTMTGTMVVK
jgi:plastocyanin